MDVAVKNFKLGKQKKYIHQDDIIFILPHSLFVFLIHVSFYQIWKRDLTIFVGSSTS